MSRGQALWPMSEKIIIFTMSYQIAWGREIMIYRVAILWVAAGHRIHLVALMSMWIKLIQLPNLDGVHFTLSHKQQRMFHLDSNVTCLQRLPHATHHTPTKGSCTLVRLTMVWTVYWWGYLLQGSKIALPCCSSQTHSSTHDLKHG
jgi:hypothetical protein